MQRGRQLLFLAVAVYAVAWFVPVIKDGATLTDGVLPGWQAFRFALSPIWRYGSGQGNNPLYLQVLSVASGLSNFVFVAAALAGLLRAQAARALRWPLLLGALINLHWIILLDHRSDLRPGYYLWALAYFGMFRALKAR